MLVREFPPQRSRDCLSRSPRPTVAPQAAVVRAAWRARRPPDASRVTFDCGLLTSALEIATVARILSPGCAGRHSPFPATPARAETRCGNPRPTASPDTPDTVPTLSVFAAAPAREIQWREENAGWFFLTCRTPLRWRGGSIRVGGPLGRLRSAPSFFPVAVGSFVDVDSF